MVVQKFILQLEAQLADRHVTIESTDAAIDWLAKNGFDELYGRPPARAGDPGADQATTGGRHPVQAPGEGRPRQGHPRRGQGNADVENLLLTGFDVMDRRDRGERLASTQIMFGGSHAVTIATPHASSLQGEGDDPIGVVLTRSASAPPPVTVAQSMTTRTAADHPKVTRNWWVQVGEFRDRRQAKSQVEQVAKRFSRQFDDAEGSVDGRGHRYRAVFSGFTESTAHEACGAVRSRGMACEIGRQA